RARRSSTAPRACWRRGCCEAEFTRFHSIPLTRKGPTHPTPTPTAPSSRRYHESKSTNDVPTAEAASASNGNSSAKVVHNYFCFTCVCTDNLIRVDGVRESAILVV